MGAVIGWKQLGSTLIAKVGGAGWAFHVETAFGPFNASLAIGTSLTIFNNVLQGFTIVLTKQTVALNPRKLFLAFLLLFFRCCHVTATQFNDTLWLTMPSVIEWCRSNSISAVAARFLTVAAVIVIVHSLQA
jgi:hypothetical protein